MIVGDGDISDLAGIGLRRDPVVSIRDVTLGNGDVARSGGIDAVGIGRIWWSIDFNTPYRQVIAYTGEVKTSVNSSA
jgi:hypothetical protein